MVEVAAAISEQDIELPDDIRRDPFTPEICRTTAAGALPADEAWRRFAEPLEPLRAMLRMFRASRVMRVAVMGIPPMSLDEEDCDRNYRLAGVPPAPRSSMLAWRYKTLLLTNAALRRICGDEEFPYIDRWAAYSHDGFVRPELLRDFVHLNEQGMLMTASALIDALADKPEPAADGVYSDSIRQRYDESYYRNDCGGHEEYGLFHGRKLEEARLATVYALAAVEPAARVLDIGCGRGELAYAFARDGAQVTALDYSPAAIELARATLGVLPARLLCADASTFSDSEGYAVAVAAMLVEGFAPDELARLYSNVGAMLRPAGTFVLHTSARGDAIATHRALARETFDHVLLWVAASDDPRGSLAHNFSAEELRDTTELFLVASHSPIDAQSVLRRITTEADVDGAAAASLSALSAPSTVRAGKPFAVGVTLRNDGPVPLTSFPPNPIRFAYAWSRSGPDADHEEVFGASLGRSRIEPGLKPGSTERYALSVIAPPELGTHVLRVTLVQEMARWFDVEAQAAIEVT
jgi:SAM-dependent methyltransferase